MDYCLDRALLSQKSSSTAVRQSPPHLVMNSGSQTSPLTWGTRIFWVGAKEMVLKKFSKGF